MWTLTNFEIWARRRRISGLVILPFLIFLLQQIQIEGARVPGVDKECNQIASIMRNKEFTYPWWSHGALSSSTENSSSPVCPVGRSGDRGSKCCKELDAPIQRREMSDKFSEKWLGPKLTANADIFKERRKKFDVTFKDLLTRAHAAFHAMFERT